MAANEVFQLKKLFPVVNDGPAEIDIRLGAHILNLAGTDDFVDVDPQLALIGLLHSNAQGPDFSPGITDADDVHTFADFDHRSISPSSV